MTRSDIARATYDVAERLNDIKRRHHLIEDAAANGVAARLRAAGELLEGTGSAMHPTDAAAEMANHGTMFGDDGLKWPIGQRFRVGMTLVWRLAAGLGQELVHATARMAGHYDTAALKCRA